MSFDNINLEKGMYAHPSKSFSEILEELDPTQNYIGTELEGLDAFGRQLKRFNISVSGPDSDYIGKFFATTSSAALFPEYVSRAVKQGVEEADMLSDIIASTTKINGMDYRSIASIPTDSAKNLSAVDEGDSIPTTDVAVQANLVSLNKRGRMLVASYEALKFQKVDLFSVTLRQIGAHIARQQFADAVSVLINGDGNTNPAATVDTATENVLAYGDLLNLYAALDPYNMDRMIVSPAMMLNIMQLSEFKNPLCGINFIGTGNPGNPLGAKLLKSSAVADGKVIGLDSRCALEKVVAQDVCVDYDKLIDHQLERAAITTIIGFAKIFTGASSVLTLEPEVEADPEVEPDPED